MTRSRAAPARIGTAGWSLPRELQPRFTAPGTHLERYAAVFDAAEINSTFHRSHRDSTYERWAASVPAHFRFSVKVPKTITHGQRLAGTDALVEMFLGEVEPIAARIGCLLVQLPPSLQLEPRVAREFFAHLRERFPGPVALEPRHASWFTPAAERMLAKLEVARVAADPAKAPGGGDPGGWEGLVYYRLHGSPRVYYSSYEEEFLAALAARLRAHRAGGTPAWCIFDNTTLGAGTANALALRTHLAR
jgi:uncharacterized protein YecE (DUF72 family)